MRVGQEVQGDQSFGGAISHHLMPPPHAPRRSEADQGDEVESCKQSVRQAGRHGVRKEACTSIVRYRMAA